MPVLEEPKPYQYLALGDSYTIGERVAEAERFPVQLADRLRGKGIDMQAPEIIAKTGWRTENLKQAIEDQNIVDTFDLVSLLIGVNNQYQGVNFDQYEAAFSDLLDTAIELAGGKKDRVFIVSIPDYAYSPFGQNRPDPASISEEIDAYNAINKSVADTYGITYFDITPISREALEDADLIAADGLHPSGKMYGRWVDIMWEKVITMLP